MRSPADATPRPLEALGSQIAARFERLAGPILVIGASGFVGANLLRRGLAVRRDIIGTVLSGPAWRLEGVSGANLCFLDLQDRSSITEVLDRVQPRTLFNCAAFGAYPFQTDPLRIHKTNYLALVDLFEALARRDIEGYVHAGSSSEYGLNAAAPAEDSVRLPNSHYAVSKSAAAELIAYTGRVRGLPVVNLRLYSVYGPYEDSSRLVPTLVLKGLDGALPPFVDPDTSRDFVHVDDVVLAFLHAAERAGADIAGRSFNIGAGRRVTIREVAAITRAQFGISSEPVFEGTPPRTWDVPNWFADPRQATRDLGWTAAISFEEGLAHTAEWWREAIRTRSPEVMTERTKRPTGHSSISAVIACYKDAEAIPIMHRRLTDVFRKLGIDYEIIFVNDCSPDDSEELIRALSLDDPHVIGISHSRNFGSQAAFRSGMEIASREACVLLDGDLQDPPELIEAFVAKWREGFDVVYGRRVRREMSRFQNGLYKGFYRLFGRLSDIPVPSDAGDFSLIDRRAVTWLLACQERDSFLRGLRAYIGFRQIGVDYVRPERMFGRSTNSFWKNLGWAKRAIFSFSTKPLNALSTVGIFSFLVAVGLMLLVAALRLAAPDIAPRGVTTIVLVAMFFGSLNLLGIAILGEYIGKIIQEAKGRPHFIRTAVITGGRIERPEETPTVGRAGASR